MSFPTDQHGQYLRVGMRAVHEFFGDVTFIADDQSRMIGKDCDAPQSLLHFIRFPGVYVPRDLHLD